MSDQAFPLPPETVNCAKCLRDVVIASTPRQTMESECAVPACPIRTDPDNQVGDLWGTSISFAAPSEISQEGRIDRFAAWEKRSVEVIRADLLQGGTRFVGGPPAVRDLAWEWVRTKEVERTKIPDAPPLVKAPADLLILKPTLWGMGFDLREAWRRGRRWWRGNHQ
jgi:hypothetical protein